MASSDTTPPVWSTDPLLSGKSQTPRFLRTQWDESSARAFGPWRLAEKVEPAEGLMTERTDDNTPDPDHPVAASLTGETANDTPNDASAQNHLSDSALEEIKASTYEEGLQAGLAQAHAEIEAERIKERELLRHLGIELRSISQDPQRFFDPLKRLALHVAEQLVRAELQLSGQAIQHLIQECIQQLDHASAPVVVNVNPDDLQRLKAMGDAVTDHLQLEADPLLRAGSVRVRVQDAVVQDLIEHRLEPLARKLLMEPEAWMQQSSLLNDDVQALPADTPSRDWSHRVLDIQDTEIKDVTPSPETDA